MIVISKPTVTETCGYARMSADISVDGERHTVWIEVETDYRDFLCPERSDGFVIGILNYAMTNGHDIQCEAPVGEYLYYNLTEHFIESLYRNSGGLHRTRLIAETDPTALETAGAVGTGFSCGVDSFHAVAANSGPLLPGHKITHLAFYNVGSHAGEGESSRSLFRDRSDRARRFAAGYGYRFVHADSNIADEFPQEHYFVHIYSNMFAVFCMQKLYGVYYYSSASPYSTFSLRDSELHSPDRYELLSVFSFSTDTLKVYSEGGSIPRFEKTRLIANYPPSYDSLNVCITEADNCGVCHKCRRTIMDLYALDALDRYGKVFDLDYFDKHKAWYLAKAYAYYKGGNAFAAGSYGAIKNEITLAVKIKSLPTRISIRIANMKPGVLKRGLMKLIARIKR